MGCVGSIAEDGSPPRKVNSQGCSCRVTPGGGGQRSLRSSSSIGSQSRQATPGGAGGQGDRTLGRGCERHFLCVGSSTCLGQFHYRNNPPGRLLMPCLPDPGSQTLCDGSHSHLDEPFSPSACPLSLVWETPECRYVHSDLCPGLLLLPASHRTRGRRTSSNN